MSDFDPGLEPCLEMVARVFAGSATNEGIMQGP